MYENYGQNGYYGGQNNYAVIPQQQQQAQRMQSLPIRDVRFVTREEANAYIVFPNTCALLIDRANGMVYLKTADNMGLSVMEYFKYERVNQDGTPIVSKSEQSDMEADFVRKSEMEKYGFVTQEQYNVLLGEIKTLQSKQSKTADKLIIDEE